MLGAAAAAHIAPNRHTRRTIQLNATQTSIESVAVVHVGVCHSQHKLAGSTRTCQLHVGEHLTLLMPLLMPLPGQAILKGVVLFGGA